MRWPRLRMAIGLLVGPSPLLIVLAIPVWRVNKHMTFQRLDDVGLLAIGALVAGGLGLLIAIAAIITARAALKRSARPAAQPAVREFVAAMAPAAPAVPAAPAPQAPIAAPTPLGPPAAAVPAMHTVDDVAAYWRSPGYAAPVPDPVQQLHTQVPIASPSVVAHLTRPAGSGVEHDLAVSAAAAITHAAQNTAAVPAGQLPELGRHAADGPLVRTQAMPVVTPTVSAAAGSIFAPPAPHVRTASPAAVAPIAHPPTDLPAAAEQAMSGGWPLPPLPPWARPADPSTSTAPAGNQ